MEGGNAALVRQFLERARDEPEEVWGIYGDDVVWDVASVGMLDFPPRSRGPDMVREFFRRWTAPFTDWGYDVEDIVGRGDVVVTQIRQWGRGKGSGAIVEQRFWQLWEMRDGRADRVTHFANRAEALGAAGLGN